MTRDEIHAALRRGAAGPAAQAAVELLLTAVPDLSAPGPYVTVYNPGEWEGYIDEPLAVPEWSALTHGCGRTTLLSRGQRAAVDVAAAIAEMDNLHRYCDENIRSAAVDAMARAAAVAR